MNKIEGFTPVSDHLIDEFDLLTAVIYGKIWRYWDAYGKCSAANKRLADELDISARTVVRKCKLLESGGYIEKLRAGKSAGKPNIWVPTGKIAYRTIIKETIDGVTESPTPMTQSHRGCDTESHKDTTIERDIEIFSSAGADNGEFDPFAGLSFGSNGNGKPKTEKQKTEYVRNMELLESAFSAARGCALPDWERDPKGSNKRWRMPLARMWRKAEQDTQFVKRGIYEITKQFISDNMTFDAPDQIEKTFGSWMIDQKNGNGHGVDVPAAVIVAPAEDKRKNILELQRS